MKNFDPPAAKRGATVCTRDGWPVRILCFDCRMKLKVGISCPIVAEVFFKDVDFKNGNWAVAEYDLNGKYRGKDSLPHYNLMMADDDYLEKLERGEYDHIEDNLEMAGKSDHIGESTEMVDWDYWRRMYAGMAMQGFCRENGTIKSANMVASVSIEYADALIEELKKTE